MSETKFLAVLSGEWSTVNLFLDHLAKRPADSFLLPHDSQKEAWHLLNDNYPEYLKAVIATADAACINKLNLLGKVFHFPDGIDWNVEPVTDLRWPLWHRSRIGQYLGSPNRPADLIRFWELNRQQHFIALGIAYWLTGEQKYVEAFCSQIIKWIDSNPLQHGLNWYYGLEVSIRLLAWTAAFQFFRTSDLFRKKAGSVFIKSLWQQAEFLSKHLQTTRGEDVPNNHMIAELAGLILIGTSFPEFSEANKWVDQSINLLSQQIHVQTHADGVNKEQASGYHRFVAELLLLVVVRTRRHSHVATPELESVLESMLEYILYSIAPDGTTPMWGDSDYGCALRFGQDKDYWDFRHLLSAGAVLFRRGDLKFAAGQFHEEAFWILGPRGLKTWQQIESRKPETASRAFPQAGIYVIRNNWDSDGDVAYFRSGQFGFGGEGHCAHAHCDLLSFELWESGRPILVDSGTFTYSGPWRDYFRLTGAHNTVMINGNEQAKPMLYFNWKELSEARCLNWNVNHAVGSLSYPGSLEITRELRVREKGHWDVVDSLKEINKNKIEWFFHFAPGIDLTLRERDPFIKAYMNDQLILKIQKPRDDLLCMIRDGWYSKIYGVKHPNRVLYSRWQGELGSGPLSFRWVFQFLGNRVNSNSG